MRVKGEIPRCHRHSFLACWGKDCAIWDERNKQCSEKTQAQALDKLANNIANRGPWGAK